MEYSPLSRVFGLILLLLMAVSPLPVQADESPGDAVDRLFDAYRSASVEEMITSYASDAVFEDVNQRHSFQGTGQLSQFLAGIVAVHQEMGLREKRRLVSGQTVVVEYEYVGVLNGAVLGSSMGKEGCPDLDYAIPTTSWYEVENGKITRQRDFIDWATFLELRQEMLAAATSE